MCMGGLLSFLSSWWWLCGIPCVVSALPLVLSFLSANSGRPSHIAYMSTSHCGAVCCAIVVTCMVMTLVETSVSVVNFCKSDDQQTSPYPTLPDGEVDCTDYTFMTQSNLSSNRAIITALVVIYGSCCIVMNGVSMMYSFFLYRRARNQPANWLVSSGKFSNKMQQRSISASTV